MACTVKYLWYIIHRCYFVVAIHNIQYYHAVALEVNHKEEDQDLGCPKLPSQPKGGCSNHIWLSEFLPGGSGKERCNIWSSLSVERLFQRSEFVTPGALSAHVGVLWMYYGCIIWMYVVDCCHRCHLLHLQDLSWFNLNPSNASGSSWISASGKGRSRRPQTQGLCLARKKHRQHVLKTWRTRPTWLAFQIQGSHPVFIVVGLNAFQQIVSPEVFTSFYFSVPKLPRKNLEFPWLSRIFCHPLPNLSPKWQMLVAMKSEMPGSSRKSCCVQHNE